MAEERGGMVGGGVVVVLSFCFNHSRSVSHYLTSTPPTRPAHQENVLGEKSGD